MTPEELREILSREEGVKLEFKLQYKFDVPVDKGASGYQEWKRCVDGQWHEFIKDILSLANGNSPVTGEPGILVVGAHDKLSSDGVRQIEDVGALRRVTKQDVYKRVNDFADPPLRDIDLDFVELEGKTLMIVRIPDTGALHYLRGDLITTVFQGFDPDNQSVKYRSGPVYHQGVVFVRRGEKIDTANRTEQEAIRAENQARQFTVSLAPIQPDRFLLHEDERQRVKDTFVEPTGYASFRRAIRTARFLWLTGPVGIGKLTCALHLAIASVDEQSVYVIPRGTPWHELTRTDMHGATIVFPDALGKIRFDRDELDTDLTSLDELLARGHTVIVTCPDDVFEDAQRNSRLTDWLGRRANCQGKIERSAYSLRDQQTMLEKHISFAAKTARMDSQYKLARKLLPDRLKPQEAGAADPQLMELHSHLQQRLRDWMPLDVVRFVSEVLPGVRTQEELAELLRLGTDVEQPMQEWLGELPPDVQAFVVTLAAWSGRSDAQIWEAHCQVIKELRPLNPNLAMLPLGVLRQRVAPHVTRHGTLRFTSLLTRRTVVCAAAATFREYYLQVINLLRRWSIPDLAEAPKSASDEERRTVAKGNDRLIMGTEDVRNAVAELVGELGKGGIEGVAELLAEWAKTSHVRISKTVGISLARMLEDPRGIQPALDLLQAWAQDTSQSEESGFRAAAAASAVWRLYAAQGSIPYRSTLLELLHDLAGDGRAKVVTSAAHSARMISRSAGMGELAPTLARLAGHYEKYARQQTAFALNEIAARRDRSSAKGLVGLLDAWSASDNRYVNWTAMCALLFGDNMARMERHDLLGRLIAEKPGLFLDVVAATVNPRDERSAEIQETAARCFVKLTEPPPNGIRPALVQALARWELEQPRPSLMDDIVSLLPTGYPEQIHAFLALLCRQMLLDAAGTDPERLLPLLTSLLTLTDFSGLAGRDDARQITAQVSVDLVQARQEGEWGALLRDALAKRVATEGSPFALLTFYELLPDSAHTAFADLIREVLPQVLNGMAAADDPRLLGTLFAFHEPPPPTATPLASPNTGWTLDIPAMIAEAVTSRIQDPQSRFGECLARQLAAQVVAARNPEVLVLLQDLVSGAHVPVLDSILRRAVYQAFSAAVTVDAGCIPVLFEQFQEGPAIMFAEEAMASVRAIAQPEPEGQREQWLARLDALDSNVYTQFDVLWTSSSLKGRSSRQLTDSVKDLRDGIGPCDSALVEGLALDLRCRLLRRRLDATNRSLDEATGELLSDWLQYSQDREVLWAALSYLEEDRGPLLIERLADICALCPTLVSQMATDAPPATTGTLLSSLTAELAHRVAEVAEYCTAFARSAQPNLAQILELKLRDPHARFLVTEALQRMSDPSFPARPTIAQGLARSIMSDSELALTGLRELGRRIPNISSLLYLAYAEVQHEVGLRFRRLLRLSPVLLVDMLIELSAGWRTSVAKWVLSSTTFSPDRSGFIEMVARGVVDHNPANPLVSLNRLFPEQEKGYAPLRDGVIARIRRPQPRREEHSL